MSAVNQKEYLKRYLSKDKDKKKRKKHAKGIKDRVKIIDDNIDVQDQVQTIQDIENDNEDAPQVVAVIDDRPVHLRLDKYKDQSNWTTVDREVLVKREPESPERKGDSTPRRRNENSAIQESTDENPPRQKKHSNPDDTSPPRRSGHVSDASPPRRRRHDSDASPPRKCKHDSDTSPPRRRKSNNAVERFRNSDDNSPPRRQRNYDSDENPPRRRKHIEESETRSKNNHSSSRNSHSDHSPPRRKGGKESVPSRLHDRINEESPHRRNRYQDSSKSPQRSSQYSSHRNRNDKKSRWKPKSPSPEQSTSSKQFKSSSSSKATKTLDGKTAGLQNAKDLATETNNFRKREAKLFAEMAAELSGANAATVMRDRKTGKVRDLEAEAQEKSIHNEKANALKKNYDRWGKGVKQTADYQEKLQAAAYEMSKPLARYADDEDLERHLKEQERAGDPMLQYIKKKKREDAVKAGVKLKPEYMGEFMPNRFGIRPGHRWDGVDRSNGYEKKWFDAINKRNADREEAYKWNSEDM